MTLIDEDEYEDLNVFDQLVEIISKMTDDEQEKLLEVLKKRRPEERAQRISLYTEAKFTVGDIAYNGVVMDLSSGGLFIETDETFTVGQEVAIDLKRPKDAKIIKVRGRIARVEHNGIGIQFYK